MTQPNPAPDAAAHDWLAQQAHEYGQYVATQNIFVGTALAYREGDPVPASNVTQWGYEANGLVRRVGGSEAPTGQQAPASTAPEPVAPITDASPVGDQGSTPTTQAAPATTTSAKGR